MGSLVTAAQVAYNTWKEANWPADVAGWNALTDAQKLALWSTEQQYQLGISDARAIEESFYEADQLHLLYLKHRNSRNL